MNKTAQLAFVSIVLMVGGCSKQSQIQPSATSGTPPVVQAAAPAPASAPAPEPEVRGIVTQEDGTEFVAKLIKNECGTNADPTECLFKTVQIESDPYLICPSCTPFAVGFYGVKKNEVDVTQITLQLEDGSYLALGCAISAVDPVVQVDISDEAMEGAYFSGYNDANPSKHLCDHKIAGGSNPTDFLWDPFERTQQPEQYRFGRRGNTVVFHRNYGGVDWRMYFLVFGTCTSVHECQDLPRRFHFKDDHWQTVVAPWVWESYRMVEGKDKALKAESEARLEAKKKYLDAPR